jgi:hypothetical protein
LSALNANIPIYNGIVREMRYGKNAPQIIKGEILTAYANELRTRDKLQPYKIVNSTNYIVVSDPIKTRREIPYTDINDTDEPIVVDGFEVKVRSVLNPDPMNDLNVFIIDNNTDNKILQKISYVMDMKWKEYARYYSNREYSLAGEILTQIRKIQQSFITMKDVRDTFTDTVKRSKTFDYGYTWSIHKSQGCTFDKVLVIGGSIEGFGSAQQRPHLKYVAVTRAKEQVIYTVPEEKTITVKQQPNAELQALADLGVKRQLECK